MLYLPTQRSTAVSRSLSDLKNRSEKGVERGQILTISPGNSGSIAQESGEIWVAQRLLQPISFKSDRLLGSYLLKMHNRRGSQASGLSQHICPNILSPCEGILAFLFTRRARESAAAFNSDHSLFHVVITMN